MKVEATFDDFVDPQELFVRSEASPLVDWVCD